MTDAQILKKLRGLLGIAGSEHKLAATLKVSRSYLGDVLRERTAPGPLILDALGLERTKVVRRKVKA